MKKENQNKMPEIFILIYGKGFLMNESMIKLLRKKFHSGQKVCLVWLGYFILMAYQPSLVILYQRYTLWKTNSGTILPTAWGIRRFTSFLRVLVWKLT